MTTKMAPKTTKREQSLEWYERAQQSLIEGVNSPSRGPASCATASRDAAPRSRQARKLAFSERALADLRGWMSSQALAHQ